MSTKIKYALINKQCEIERVGTSSEICDLLGMTKANLAYYVNNGHWKDDKYIILREDETQEFLMRFTPTVLLNQRTKKRRWGACGKRGRKA